MGADQTEAKELDADPRIELKMREWDTVIRTQMHFNEMILKMRTLVATAVAAIFGASAAAFSQGWYISVGIAAFGLVLMAGVFILDYFYYFRLLLGAVEKGYEIDKAFADKRICGTRIFGLSTMIRDSVGPPDVCRQYIILFYGLVRFPGIHAKKQRDPPKNPV
jgi:hypothetical protein